MSNPVGHPKVATGELASKIGEIIEITGGNVGYTHRILTQTNGANLKEIASIRKSVGLEGTVKLVERDGKMRPISKSTVRTVAADLGIEVRGAGRPKDGESWKSFINRIG